MASDKRGPCSTPETIADLLLIGCLVVVTTLVFALIAVACYGYWWG